MAEIRRLWPTGSPRESLAIAHGLQQLATLDEVDALPLDGPLSGAQRDRLGLVASRLAVIAKLAADAGVTGPLDELEERDVERHGVLVVSALRAVGRRLLESWSALPGADYLELERWLMAAVPAALRGEELPGAPRPWARPRPVVADRQLESAVVVWEREAVAVSEALNGGEPGSASSSRADAGPVEDGRSIAERERAWLRDIGKLSGFGAGSLMGGRR